MSFRRFVSPRSVNVVTLVVNISVIGGGNGGGGGSGMAIAPEHSSRSVEDMAQLVLWCDAKYPGYSWQ